MFEQQLGRALRMEWFRLRTLRSTWLIVGLCLVSSVGLAVTVVLVHDGPADADLARAVLNPGQPAPMSILLGILGVLAWGHDHRYGTVRPLLTALPDRRVLAAARTLVMTGVLIAVSLLCEALAWVAGLVTSQLVIGRPDLTGFASESLVQRQALGMVLLGLGIGWFGLALGALIPSLPAALAAYVMYPAVIEPMVAMLVAQVSEPARLWLPFASFGSLIGMDEGGPPPVVAGMLFLGVMMMLNLAGLARIRTRDV